MPVTLSKQSSLAGSLSLLKFGLVVDSTTKKWKCFKVISPKLAKQNNIDKIRCILSK